jgi:hypothetical protein
MQLGDDGETHRWWQIHHLQLALYALQQIIIFVMIAPIRKQYHLAVNLSPLHCPDIPQDL